MGRGNAESEQPSAPGWYPDPWSATGAGERYFDGDRWRTTERPLEQDTTALETVDPLGTDQWYDLVESGGAGSPPQRHRLVNIGIVVAVVGALWCLVRLAGAIL
jgi:hypothetical protein